MAGNYVQPGNVLDVTVGATTASGDVVVVGAVLGVALADIANAATGPVQVTGVFTVPKVSAAVIKMGETLTWDSSAGKFDDNLASPATGDVTGASAFAWEDAGNNVTSLQVKFTGIPGTVAS